MREVVRERILIWCITIIVFALVAVIAVIISSNCGHQQKDIKWAEKEGVLNLDVCAQVEIIDRNEIVFQSNSYLERIDQLKASDVQVVICGSISNDMLVQFKRKGIEVIAWVTGEAEKALQVFMQGKLIPGAMLCPGRRMRQWRFCSRAARRQRSGENQGMHQKNTTDFSKLSNFRKKGGV